MAEKIKNRVRQTCTGSGTTGNLNIANGSAPPGFKKVISLGGYQVGDKGIFCVESQGNYEIFYGTVLDSDTLSRGTADDFIESNTGSRIDLNAATVHTVFCDLDAAGYVYVDSTGVAQPGKSILRGSTVDTVSDLTSIAGDLASQDEGVVYLVTGGAGINDGRGGIYRWSGTAFERVYLRKLLKFGTYVAGEATQDVANIDALVTAGSEPITDLTNGSVGQTVTIFRGASDIDIVDSSTMNLGGVNITLTESIPSVSVTRVLVDVSTEAWVRLSGSISGEDTKVIATGSITARNLADRFGEFINVADYGAVSSGTGLVLDAAFQDAVDALPSTGGDIIVPPGVYSNITPANINVGEKVVNWRADGATLPADMPGVVIKTHDISEPETYQQSNRTSRVHYHYDAGDIAPPVGKRQYVHHVTAFLDDTADADEREFRAYSFTLETDTTNSNSDIRGMKGRVAATGGAANLRAIYGVADSSNGHTGLLTGLIGTCIRADGQTNEIAAVRGHLQPGTAPNGAIAFEAAGNGASRDASFGFRVRGGSGAALNCVTACFYGHGGGGGAIFRGDRSGTDTTTVFNVGPNGETVATVSETSGSAAIESILGIGNSSGTHNGAVTGVKGTVTRGEGQTNEVVGVAATIDPGTLSNGAIAYDAAGAGAAYTISIGYRVRGGSTALNCATANFYGHGGGGGDIIRGDVSAADTTAVFRATADGQVLAKSFISGEVTIADDAVYSFTPHDTNGIMIFMTRDTNQAYGMIWFRASGTNLVGEMTVGPIVDTNSEVTPTGTTGTDGNILITADEGQLHIENRTGAARVFNWMMIQRLA
jgi:hypothetical protein